MCLNFAVRFRWWKIQMVICTSRTSRFTQLPTRRKVRKNEAVGFWLWFHPPLYLALNWLFLGDTNRMIAEVLAHTLYFCVCVWKREREAGEGERREIDKYSPSCRHPWTWPLLALTAYSLFTSHRERLALTLSRRPSYTWLTWPGEYMYTYMYGIT